MTDSETVANYYQKKLVDGRSPLLQKTLLPQIFGIDEEEGLDLYIAKITTIICRAPLAHPHWGTNSGGSNDKISVRGKKSIVMPQCGCIKNPRGCPKRSSNPTTIYQCGEKNQSSSLTEGTSSPAGRRCVFSPFALVEYICRDFALALLRIRAGGEHDRKSKPSP